MSDLGKITEQHRRRRAVVYVRQSTPTQLERNHESRARQYALRQRALDLGWPAQSVSVVDEDLGRSGAGRNGRSVQRAGISPELPSTSRHNNTVSPVKSSVDQPNTPSTTSRNSPGAATSRTRSGKTSTT